MASSVPTGRREVKCIARIRGGVPPAYAQGRWRSSHRGSLTRVGGIATVPACTLAVARYHEARAWAIVLAGGEGTRLRELAIAYFSMEIALDPSIPMPAASVSSPAARCARWLTGKSRWSR